MFAYAALLAWPVVTIILFQMLPSRRAIIWSLLGAYLLLPVGAAFRISGVPDFDKLSIPNLSMVICAILFARNRVLALPQNWGVIILIIIFILSPFVTGLNNRDPLILSRSALPPMSNYDALSACVRQLIQLLPFLVGYTALKRQEDHREILLALVLGALAYTLPMLIELRISPQLHRIAYGYHPHEFQQQVRDGGYRPVVFIGHGLLVATFVAMAFVAALGLRRQGAKLFHIGFASISAWLFVLLFLCKSFGAIALGSILGLVTNFLRPRNVITLCCAAAMIVLAYPAMRGLGLVPTTTISSLAGAVNPERQASFDFRIRNEDELLAKASSRPFFGWGTWGRNQIYADNYVSDKMVSVADGMWIGVIGTYGWFGYIAWFGLLTFPFVRAFRYRRIAQHAGPTVQLLVVLLLNLVDLIPNASLTPITLLLAGAMSGALYKQPVTASDGEEGRGSEGEAPYRERVPV